MTLLEDSTQDAPDPLLGRVIAGNFRIERLIGSGATGNVYQAEQLSLGKAVAVKVLHAHLTGDDKLVKRFQREAKSASRLNHPNSIRDRTPTARCTSRWSSCRGGISRR
jgi:serine/threonine protein kinase